MSIQKGIRIQRRTKKNISYIYICLLLISFCLSYPVDASDATLLNLSFEGDLQDSSGNNFDGRWDGNGSFAPGKSGQAAVFTPDNGNSIVIDHDGQLGGMEQITITVWAKKNNPSSTGVLIRKHMHYSLSVGDNSVNSYVGSSSNELGRANVFDVSLVNDTDWHYYVLTYDGSMVRLYIDNQQVAEKPLSGDVLNDGYDIKIGPFDGLIDELSIYTENLDVQPPTIPQGLSGSVFSHSELRLSWDESSDNIGVEGYRIYRNDQLIFETAETFYNDMGLNEKTDYEYKVTAYDENNNESLPSEAISLRTYAQNNNAPTINLPDTIQINEGEALSYIIPASDIDDDPIFFSCKNLPAGSTLDAETGEFSWRPVYSQAGIYEIPITVSDLRLETMANLNVVVNNVPSTSKIRIEPGDLVEVGEEVYFDAMQYYSHGDDAEYRWNFGDGYAMEPGTPAYNFRDSGTACTHYFMKPGSYEVVLTIVKDDEILATDSVFVAVKGEEPVAGFEVWHAPFRSRVSQRVYIQIPQNINVHRVTASLKGEKGFDHKYLDVTNPAAEESFRLVNKDLIADKYVLEVKLFDSKGDCISLIREKYNKTIDGAPKIGVNEDNAYMIDGKDLFFPITPFMMNKGNEIWPKMYINTFHTEGWYESHNADTWNDYVKTAYDKGLYAIGPERWDGKVSRLQERYARNSNVDMIEEYVLKSKDLPGMFGWCWDDEPTLGGTTGYIPPQVHAAWSYRTQMHDDYHHPVVLQMYGFGYLPYYNPLSPDRISGYDFLSSAQQFGGKKAFVADGTGSDIYPFFAASHVAFDSSERGLYDLWVEALQNQVKLNYDMIPVTLFVGTQCIMAPEKLNDLSKWQAGPTPEFVRMETWLGVINGAKGINYFHAFSPTPADNMSVLGEFREVVEDLAPVILGPVPERTVTDSANERGNRVDTMIRETNEDIYIFASRLSEPESQWDEVFEPETIEVEFQVSDLTNTSFAYEELEKYRWTYDCFDVTESTNKFSGVLSQVPLRPDTVCITVVKSIDPDKPLILIDRMTGKEYDYPTHSMGNLINLYDDGTGNLASDKFGVSGTINYETGEFEINLPNPIPAGERYVRVGYSKENRAARIIDINNDGTFIDTFERNDVRIYRITKQAEPYIMQQPLSKTITEGSDIELKVLAGGTPELRYQWYFNGDIIENASSNTLDITNVQVDDGGEYFVEIKNDLGSVISDTVTLTVTDPLPQVLEFNCITEFYSNYLSWKNPANQAENWDSIIIVRKEGSEPTGPDDGEIIYDGIGCSLIDKNLSDGDYYYAAYTYMDFTTNTLYSEPIHRSVSIPEMFNKDYLLVKPYQDQINENSMIIGQNTEGDSYSLWNTSSINIGKGPGGNNTGLWIYSDIVGTNSGQAPTDSKIVSARLVFNVEDSNLIDSETNEGNSINHPHSISIYRITDPQGLGTPHYADESGMRVGLDYNYRDHRPGINVPWVENIPLPENAIESQGGATANILYLFDGDAPVDTIEFLPEAYENEQVDTLQFDITKAVQAWADGEDEQGLFVSIGQHWKDGESLQLAGITADDETNRPYIEVIYGTDVNNTDLTPPARVEGLSIIPDSERVTLNWDNPTDLDFEGVKIIRRERIVPFNSQDGDVVTFVDRSSDTNNDYVDTEVEVGKTYYYALYTYDNQYNYSEKVWTKGTPGSPSSAPNLQISDIGSGKVEFSWDQIEGAAGYRIYREDSTGILFQRMINQESTPGIRQGFTDYVFQGEYIYWVTAVNEHGEGPYSIRLSVTISENDIAEDVPVEPSSFIVEKVSDLAIELSWVDNSTNESRFVLERKTDDSDWEVIAGTEFNVERYIDEDIQPGTIYYYRIKAVNSAGESDYISGDKSIETSNITVAVKNISWEVISASQVKVEWEDTPNEDSYRVELFELAEDRGTINEYAVDTLSLSADITYCYFVKLEPGKEYRVRVTSIKGADDSSKESDIIRTSVDPRGGLFQD